MGSPESNPRRRRFDLTGNSRETISVTLGPLKRSARRELIRLLSTRADPKEVVLTLEGSDEQGKEKADIILVHQDAFERIRSSKRGEKKRRTSVISQAMKEATKITIQKPQLVTEEDLPEKNDMEPTSHKPISTIFNAQDEDYPKPKAVIINPHFLEYAELKAIVRNQINNPTPPKSITILYGRNRAVTLSREELQRYSSLDKDKREEIIGCVADIMQHDSSRQIIIRNETISS